MREKICIFKYNVTRHGFVPSGIMNMFRRYSKLWENIQKQAQ